MDDYSLVPVDHQPDFDDVSLVPVAHDPFSADSVTQQTQIHQVQAQPAQPQPPTAGVGQPNVASAASVLDKLNRYLLDSDHVRGGPKARWSTQALGFTRENAEDLAKQLVFDESQAVQRAVTQYGAKFNQTISVTGANGRTIPVITVWTVGSDGVPRLSTVLPRS